MPLRPEMVKNSTDRCQHFHGNNNNFFMNYSNNIIYKRL